MKLVSCELGWTNIVSVTKNINRDVCGGWCREAAKPMTSGKDDGEDEDF